MSDNRPVVNVDVGPIVIAILFHACLTSVALEPPSDSKRLERVTNALEAIAEAQHEAVLAEQAKRHADAPAEPPK